MEWCSPVENQSHLQSCTANALAGALEFLEKKDLGRYTDFSRLFIYYNVRDMEHSVNCDTGTQIRHGIKSLAKFGACPETLWPYDIAKFEYKPSPRCYTSALNHQITSYYRINGIREMRQCLAEGFPFVFGFSVYESFFSKNMLRTGVLNLPKKTENLIGGHAVMAVGYSEAKKRFLVRNSWGTRWGQKGYFTMPYDYLSNTNLSDDFWTIRRGEKM
jgi:C1A family cysteine protease